MSVRVARELGEALRSGPFRAALVLSLIVHLVLLVALRSGNREPGSGSDHPRMRVWLVRLEPAREPAPQSAALPSGRR